MAYADKDTQRAYNREWMRMWRAGERNAGGTCGTPGGTPIPLPFRLQTANDIIDLLSDQIEQVCSDQEITTVVRARTVGYLVSIVMKAIEITDLATRIEALENVLKAR